MEKKLLGLIKKLKNNDNKNLIRSLIISPEKLKIIQDLFKISIDINRLKKKLKFQR